MRFCVAFLYQALVDAPTETRKVVNFKRLTLTDFKVEIPRLASKKVLTEALNSAGERQQEQQQQKRRRRRQLQQQQKQL